MKLVGLSSGNKEHTEASIAGQVLGPALSGRSLSPASAGQGLDPSIKWAGLGAQLQFVKAWVPALAGWGLGFGIISRAPDVL